MFACLVASATVAYPPAAPNAISRVSPAVQGDDLQITWGSWSAMDAATGKILWQTADPNPGIDFGAVSVANGVVYAGSQYSSGFMYALDAATGKIHWSFQSGGSIEDGPSIVGNFVYWGSGYRIGTNNNKAYAFSIPNPAQRN
jgi:polyvinyl alcohol dehydrogenase (cytochrome)